MKSVVPCLVLSGFLFPFWAQAQVVELENLRTGFELRTGEYDEPLQRLAASYRKHLESLIASAQANGDLNAVLVVKEELADPGEAEGAEALPELNRAREVFLANRERLLGERAEKLAALTGMYRKNLQELMATLTRAGRLDDAVIVKTELQKAEQPKETPQPNLTLAAARNAECFALLEEAGGVIKDIPDEKARNRILRDLAAAFAKAGDGKRALGVARKISDPMFRARAVAGIAVEQATRGEMERAILTAKLAQEPFQEDYALARIAAIQLQSGQMPAAAVTASKIKGDAGAALYAVDLGLALRGQGDTSGFQRQIEAAKSLALKLEKQDEWKEVYAKIVVAQAQAGQVDAAKATAAQYRGHVFGHPLIALIGAQAEAGDYRGANETFGQAKFSMFPACLSVALIAEAQADAGKFDEAWATASRLWYSDHKLIALAAVATKKGDLPAARAAAEGLLTADHMDGYRPERFGRALAPTGVLQAKLEGLGPSLQWARGLADPSVRSLALIALGESLLQPAMAPRSGSQSGAAGG